MIDASSWFCYQWWWFLFFGLISKVIQKQKEEQLLKVHKAIEENEMRDLLPLHTRQGSRIQWLLKTVAIITLHLMMIMNRKIAVIYLWSLGRSEESTLTSAVILLLSSPISMMGSWLQSGDFWTRDPAEVFCWSPFCTTETTQASKVSEDTNRLPDIWMGASLQGNSSGGFPNARVLYKTRRFQWEFCVDKVSNPEISAYDMIIGMDLLSELAINLSFSQRGGLGGDE